MPLHTVPFCFWKQEDMKAYF